MFNIFTIGWLDGVAEANGSTLRGSASGCDGGLEGGALWKKIKNINKSVKNYRKIPNT